MHLMSARARPSKCVIEDEVFQNLRYTAIRLYTDSGSYTGKLYGYYTGLYGWKGV